MTSVFLCRKCNLEKTLDNFGADKRQKSGHRNECKTCYAEYMRNWYKINDKKVISRVRAYHASNRDELNIQRAVRAARNPEQTNASREKWKNANKEKWDASRIKALHKRRLLKGQQSKMIPVKNIIRLRNQPCHYCGSTKIIQLDHVIPISRGGSDSEGNLVSACRTCNLSKGFKFVMEWKLKTLKMKRSK